MDEEKKLRHNERMRRKKAVVDAAIERAQETRGILIVHTGNGKGKTTAAFGTLMRALGYGQQVGIVQFIKGAQATGEMLFLEQHCPGIAYHAMATGFTWETQNWDQDKQAAEQAWRHAEVLLADARISLVLLDELTYLLKYKYLDQSRVLDAISRRPAGQTVIVTGRAAPPELVELADTVSEVKDVKHAFKAGVKAQPGIDF